MTPAWDAPMTPHAAFLQAIRKAPDDDVPRLIYADWLEEHGQTDRAEFIRIQCRMPHLPETSAERDVPAERMVELLRRNWSAWVGPLRQIVGPKCDRYGEDWLREEYYSEGLTRFRRGFVNRLALDAKGFLSNADALLGLVPLRHLSLWGAGNCADALANCSHLRGLHTLAFADYWDAPLTARDAALLAASPYLHGLALLHLGRNSLSDEGVEALAQASWLASLLVLDLTDNGISDYGASVLAHCPFLSRLRRLNLRGNPISDHGRSALATSPHLRELVKLDLDEMPDGEARP